MQKSYTDYINAALDILDQSLHIYVENRLKVRYGDKWFEYLPKNIRFHGEKIVWDTPAILNTMLNNWQDAFHTELDFAGRNLVGELKVWRNTVAHRTAEKPVTLEDADRAIDTVWRLLSLIPVPQAQEVRAIRDELRAGDAPVSIPQNTPISEPQETKLVQPTPPSPVSQAEPVSQSEPAVTYNFSRFCFKASQIEPLEDNQAFRVVTPKGTFQMTKADFYKAFPKVVVSKSYAENGIYHYPSVPKTAMAFLLSE